MRAESDFDNRYKRRLQQKLQRLLWQHWRLDPLLCLALFVLSGVGLTILFSASNGNWTMVFEQSIRLLVGLVIMLVLARIPPQRYQQWSVWTYLFSIMLLLCVLLLGHIGMGAQRWLGVGPIRFQPSEFLKITTPLLLAHWFHEKKSPLAAKHIWVALAIIALPTALILLQPDLGTAVLLILSGSFIVCLAGLRLRNILFSVSALVCASPIIWHLMHGYQRNRLLTFLHPERDPLGKGYHIIQSEIAVGSGGWIGKGFMHGTQSHLSFLPTHTTDFIFSVLAEEWGFIGCLILLTIYGLVVFQAFRVAFAGQYRFERLLAGGLCCSFACSAMINIAMVIGLLPVVGVPLPLVSYGGTSLLAFMASFGMIMSIGAHRKLLPT